MTNNFYDKSETFLLPVKELTVEGEVSNPGKVDFSSLPLRSVIVKETLLDDSGSDRFTGAFRYDGYSFFDILNTRVVKKSNAKEFGSVIDLYVEVENDRGEKTVFSWGEIYYPVNLHRIIVAAGVSRIIPTKTNDLWELPGESKIIAGSDLITERNIPSPVILRVRSIAKSFEVRRELTPLYSGRIKVFNNTEHAHTIRNYPPGLNFETFRTIFYGRGRGIHSTEPFRGILLRDILDEYYLQGKIRLREGLICIAGIDGYRCAASYSEIFNRNDQQEFLLVQMEPDENGGLFRIFAASDFFSDRAVKAISEIHLLSD